MTLLRSLKKSLKQMSIEGVETNYLMELNMSVMIIKGRIDEHNRHMDNSNVVLYEFNIWHMYEYSKTIIL